MSVDQSDATLLTSGSYLTNNNMRMSVTSLLPGTDIKGSQRRPPEVLRRGSSQFISGNRTILHPTPKGRTKRLKAQRRGSSLKGARRVDSEQARRDVAEAGRALIEICQIRSIFKGELVLVLPGGGINSKEHDMRVASVKSIGESSYDVRRDSEKVQMKRYLPACKLEVIGQADGGPPIQIGKIRRLLLRRPSLVNFRDWDNSTALMAAARAGAFEVARALLARKADPGLTNNFGQTALMLAAAVPGNFETIRELLEGAKHVTWPNSTRKYNSWVNKRDATGHTALMYASMVPKDPKPTMPRSRMKSLVYVDLRVYIEKRPEPILIPGFSTLGRTQELLRALTRHEPGLDYLLEMEDVHKNHTCKSCGRAPIRGKRYTQRIPKPRPSGFKPESVCESCYEKQRLDVSGFVIATARGALDFKYCLALVQNDKKRSAGDSADAILDNKKTLKQNGVNCKNCVLMVSEASAWKKRAGGGAIPHRRSVTQLFRGQELHSRIPSSSNLSNPRLQFQGKSKAESLLTTAEIAVALLLENGANPRVNDNSRLSAYDYAQSNSYLNLLLHEKYGARGLNRGGPGLTGLDNSNPQRDRLRRAASPRTRSMIQPTRTLPSPSMMHKYDCVAADSGTMHPLGLTALRARDRGGTGDVEMQPIKDPIVEQPAVADSSYTSRAKTEPSTGNA